MKVMLLCGSHPRHLYLANRLLEENLLHSLVIEAREAFIPKPPENLIALDRENFVRHFRDRDIAEKKYFAEYMSLMENERFGERNVSVLSITRNELNDDKVSEFVAHHSPDIVITYGVHKIDPPILDQFPEDAWNIHGGLSPWYRGNITLFWPFYFLQPNWAGMTIHRLTDKIDAGEIVHHSAPVLEYGDGIHDVACKAVCQVADDLVRILQMKHRGEVIHTHKQSGSGKLFMSRDWHPSQLRMIYNTFDNDIVDAYLAGELSATQPQLIKAF